MAAAVQNRYIGSTTGATSLNVSVTVTGTDNTALLIFIYSSGSGATISSISRDGQTPTSHGSTSANSGADNLRVYRLVAPNTGTNNLSVSFSASTEAVVEVYVLTGADQTTPFGTVRTDSASASGNQRFIGFESYANGLSIGAGLVGTTASAARTAASVNGIPKWIASGTRNQATSQTSRTPANPTTLMRGDLIIAVVGKENDAAVSVSGTGWNKGGDIAGVDSSWSGAWAWAIYDGAIGDCTFSWTGSADATSQAFNYRDTKATGTPVLAIGTPGAANSATHTSTGGNTTGNDSLVAYFDLCNANTALGQPSGWTERADSGSGTGPIRVAMGTKEVATSGTGSGNISVTGGNARFVQFQLELLNSDAGDQTHGGEVEALNNFTTYASAYETGDAYSAIGFTWTTGTTLYYMLAGVGVNPVSSVDATASPGAGSITLAGQAPTVTATASATVSPGAGSLTLTGQAPSVAASYQASPDPDALTLTGQAPAIVAAASVSLGLGALTLAGQAPTIAAGALAAPGADALALAGFAPSVSDSENVGTQAGSLTLAGLAPTISASVALTPSADALTLLGYAPSVTTGAESVDATASPGAGSLTLQGYAPDVQAGSLTGRLVRSRIRREPFSEFWEKPVEPASLEEVQADYATLKAMGPLPRDLIADVAKALGARAALPAFDDVKWARLARDRARLNRAAKLIEQAIIRAEDEEDDDDFLLLA